MQTFHFERNSKVEIPFYWFAMPCGQNATFTTLTSSILELLWWKIVLMQWILTETFIKFCDRAMPFEKSSSSMYLNSVLYERREIKQMTKFYIRYRRLIWRQWWWCWWDEFIPLWNFYQSTFVPMKKTILLGTGKDWVKNNRRYRTII